jgi:hypothetical protein
METISVTLAEVHEVIKECANVQKGQGRMTGDLVRAAIGKDRKIHAQLRNVLISYAHIHRSDGKPFEYWFDESVTNPMFKRNDTVKAINEKPALPASVLAFMAKKNGGQLPLFAARQEVKGYINDKSELIIYSDPEKRRGMKFALSAGQPF